MAKEKLQVVIDDPKDEFIKRFDRMFYFIIGVMSIGFLTMLFMVAGLVIEAWRFNSFVYKESQQLKIQEQMIINNVSVQQEILGALKQIDQKLSKRK